MYLICLRTVILKMRLQLKVFGLISDRTCKIKIAWSLCCTKITFLCINRIKIKNTLTKQKKHFFVTLQYPIYKYFGTWTIICLILRVYRTCVIVHAYSWHRVHYHSSYCIPVRSISNSIHRFIEYIEFY